ncbi:MAG: SRPBCC domain-containing protein [Intrasporangium sp.]|uniref:SRPBCC family protein n=1 Tax=Intrasporangium sp. TaxID=1925024 RepID=UPI0026485129|nr:SRPBCC domain-containing protein [Intrasporangium sp.]MDN5795700.1 SRPBCC domain-containing protein [Intrasporangium sp.]
MPVIDLTKDIDNLRLTITAQFAAPVERVWALYADPRQLEQVWGPPAYPATFVDHTLTVGARSTYYMTSPDGEKFAGWWLITAVDQPSRFAFDDGFADQDFNPNPDLPISHNIYSFDAQDGGTRATFLSSYDTAEGLAQVLEMGIEEGATLAINQIDAFLAS